MVQVVNKEYASKIIPFKAKTRLNFIPGVA
jgi:hypothetical protein